MYSYCKCHDKKEIYTLTSDGINRNHVLCIVGCGGMVYVHDGLQIQSPGYPDNYPNRANCLWLLQVRTYFLGYVVLPTHLRIGISDVSQGFIVYLCCVFMLLFRVLLLVWLLLLLLLPPPSSLLLLLFLLLLLLLTLLLLFLFLLLWLI